MSSEWEDTSGTRWRFSKVAGIWQKKVGGSWQSAALPTGGLRRVAGEASAGNVIVVETMGPQGQPGPPGPPGTLISIAEVIPAGYQDGTNATFPLSVTADLGQVVQVYRNGLQEIPGQGYLVTPTHVTFTTPPLSSDVLTVVYQKAQ